MNMCSHILACVLSGCLLCSTQVGSAVANAWGVLVLLSSRLDCLMGLDGLTVFMIQICKHKVFCMLCICDSSQKHTGCCLYGNLHVLCVLAGSMVCGAGQP